MLHTARRVSCEATDMKLINDRAIETMRARRIAYRHRFNDDCARHALPHSIRRFDRHAPIPQDVTHCAGKRIEEFATGIARVTGALHVNGSNDPPRVADAHGEPFDEHMPVEESSIVFRRERNGLKRRRAIGLRIKEQFDA
ncbi:hypothetical protein PTKU46_60580 [Paraburkholderia terrae]